MKNYLKKLTLVTLSVLAIGCSSDDVEVTQDNPADVSALEPENEISDFVWKAMNNWYFWQSSVNSLADTRDDDREAYVNYLNGFSSPESLFNSLKFGADDFSWYIDDIDTQLNAFRGITTSYGIEISTLVRYNDGIYAIVAYTVPGSPAADAGISRGDLIYKVDGEVMNDSNYRIINKLFQQQTISLGLGTIENGAFTAKPEDVTISSIQLSENPVHYSSVIEEAGKKIGYLVYNGFRGTYHSELNAVFGEFKAAGIDELILDLRYNGGGSVLTSALLGSMIDGSQPALQSNAIFADLRYNEKRNPENGLEFPFFDEVYLYDKITGSYLEGQEEPMNRLDNLSRLIVLTTSRTASASELIINGLRGVGMEVVTVGDKTTGKNEASITLVDAPDTNPEEAWTDVENRNPGHNVGLQPIVSRTFNGQGQSNYGDGFPPDVEFLEYSNLEGIKPFGDPNDQQLRTALNYITGLSAKSAALDSGTAAFKVATPQERPFQKEMYILPGELTPFKNLK
ncbi:S41 family peptidase [Robertkochia flava]|uniref:S41 family peptidase n=1 Tax=Robertkochia flava TaxID=3447986 RepID=UPI001CCA57B8|nr:S41 family peptidase [Robertkochia marina]